MALYIIIDAVVGLDFAATLFCLFKIVVMHISCYLRLCE